MARMHSLSISLGLLAVLASGGCCSWFKQPAAANVVASREYCNLGLCALQDEKLPEAEMLFEQALEVCAYDERARRCYADTLWRLGKSAAALEHMEEAARLSGEDPEILIQLGRMYHSSGNQQQASLTARKALAKQRHSASAWALLADIDRAEGRSREALAKYHRAIACGDESDAVRLAIAEIYSFSDRPDRALATLNALSERYTPEEEPLACLERRGAALHRLGRHREAADCLAATVARGSTTPELLLVLGEAQMMAGDTEAARQTVAMALELRPDFAPALRLSQHLQSASTAMAARR